MTTIASFVENYIRSKPFLLSALSQGIINLTSLTRIMLPEIQEKLQKEVKQGAVVMALKRLSEDLEFRTNHKIIKVLKDIGEITVRSSLTDYTFTISDSILKKQEELLSFINVKKNVFYTSSRGVSETNIVINSSMDELIRTIFKGEEIIEEKTDLSSISIRMPKENSSTPGLYYFIFQRLAWEGIVIWEVISTSNEFTILVSENQIDTAFKVIKNLKKIS
jgi:hypothetical protein